MRATSIIDRIKDAGLSDRLISKRVVCEAVDLSLAELNRRVAKGKFPKPLVHGSARVVWKASVIDAIFVILGLKATKAASKMTHDIPNVHKSYFLNRIKFSGLGLQACRIQRQSQPE